LTVLLDAPKKTTEMGVHKADPRVAPVRAEGEEGEPLPEEQQQYEEQPTEEAPVEVSEEPQDE
jgi:hypothetical protein